jgi:hypothetical protein
MSVPRTFEAILECLSICLWLYSPLLDLGRFFSFLILYTVGRTPWTGDQPVAGPLPTHRTAQTQNKRTQTSMPKVGLETHDPSFWAGDNSSCLRPRGQCDRPECPSECKITKCFKLIWVHWFLSLYRLRRLVCSKSELTFETMNLVHIW